MKLKLNSEEIEALKDAIHERIVSLNGIHTDKAELMRLTLELLWLKLDKLQIGKQ